MLPATFGGTAADIPRAEHDGARHNTHSIWSGHAAPPARTGSLAPAGPPHPPLHLVVSREIKGWDVVREGVTAICEKVLNRKAVFSSRRVLTRPPFALVNPLD